MRPLSLSIARSTSLPEESLPLLSTVRCVKSSPFLMLLEVVRFHLDSCFALCVALSRRPIPLIRVFGK